MNHTLTINFDDLTHDCIQETIRVMLDAAVASLDADGSGAHNVYVHTGHILPHQVTVVPRPKGVSKRKSIDLMNNSQPFGDLTVKLVPGASSVPGL